MKKSKVLAAATALSLVALMGVAGCAPRAAEAPAGNSEEAMAESGTAATAWSPDLNCGACHADEQATLSEAACVAGYHASSQGFECATCHADTDGLTQAHGDMTGTKMPKKLKKTEVDSALCATCHDKTALAEATAASTALTDEQGTVVNPHDLPSNADHDKADAQCVDCHKGHDVAGIQETARDYCVGCHHENVYECNTCHEA